MAMGASVRLLQSVRKFSVALLLTAEGLEVHAEISSLSGLLKEQ